MNGYKKYAGDSQYLLARYCMPTLLNLKPSSLMNINKKTSEWNRLFMDIETRIGYFGCKAIILYENRDMVNLLIYNEKLMKMLLSSNEIKQFFAIRGYLIYEDSLSEIFSTLKIKFEQFHNAEYKMKSDFFPHEVGVLLGYPLEDVKDFISYRGKDYIYCGCWKVYHNVEEALRKFEKYRKVQQDAIRMLNNGKCLTDYNKL